MAEGNGSEAAGCCLEGDRLLTTGDMARLSNSTLRTVRFYEQEGLIEPAPRSDGAHRYFAASQLRKLQLALDLREAGLSIQDIKDLFALKKDATSPEEASRRLSGVLETQIAEMQRKIATLRRLREELVSAVSVISECRDCTVGTFPDPCCDCEVLNQPELPRAVRVLWHEHE